MTGTLQEGFKLEVEQLANKKLGLTDIDEQVDLIQIWKNKSRLANGERLNL